MHGCIAVVNHDKKYKGYSYVFNIIMNTLSVYHLAASSEEERDEWVTAMNEFIFKKPLVSSDYHTMNL